MDRVSKATGARVQTTVNGLNPVVLGTCAAFEEKQVCGKGVFIRGGGGQQVMGGCMCAWERFYVLIR